jgi:hypothetical protein
MAHGREALVRLLLYESVPGRLRRSLTDHSVRTVVEAGWSGVKDGRPVVLLRREFPSLQPKSPIRQNGYLYRSKVRCLIRQIRLGRQSARMRERRDQSAEERGLKA